MNSCTLELESRKKRRPQEAFSGRVLVISPYVTGVNPACRSRTSAPLMELDAGRARRTVHAGPRRARSADLPAGSFSPVRPVRSVSCGKGRFEEPRLTWGKKKGRKNPSSLGRVNRTRTADVNRSYAKRRFFSRCRASELGDALVITNIVMGRPAWSLRMTM